MDSMIIHLPSATSRAAHVAKLCELLPNAQVVEAVNGADAIATGEGHLAAGPVCAPRYPFALSPGEVGCFLSHRSCWQRLAESDADYALIVEDDFDIDPAAWAPAQRLVQAHGDVDSYIRLPAKPREKPVQVIAEDSGAHLFLPRRIGLQTVAQVVGRNAATRLLAASPKLDRPVDAFLQMHWHTRQTIYTILPSGVHERTAELGGSTIQSATPAKAKLAREIKRAVYRAKIATRPQTPR